MKSIKKLLWPTVLVILSMLIFGCQSEAPQTPNTNETQTGESISEVEKVSSEVKMVPIDEIIQISWQWVELIENNPAAQSVVPDPENYILTFWEDGTFSYKADCNMGNGTYTVDGNKIMFGPMMTTLAMCPPESLHDQFLALMGEMNTFGLANDNLVFTLREISGEMRFANGGLVEKPEAPSETPVSSERPSSYITIEKPKDGVFIDASQPILVSGMGGGLFEGNVVVRIEDSDGNELALQPTILQSPDAGIGGEGSWETEINISIETPKNGKIVAFSPSPKDGEGWIASDAIRVTLQPEMAPPISLENIPWQLTSLTDGNFNSALAAVQVSALLNPDEGQVNGIAGCNRYFASYKLDGSQLQVPGPIGATRMMCPEPQMSIENEYLAALEQVKKFEIQSNDNLHLFDEQGNVILVFQVDPYAITNTFTRDELANTSYLNEFATSGVVGLVDGLYRETMAADSATELVVLLTNFAAFGDLDGDGNEEAVVILISNPGGSGSFYDLAIVRKQGEALTNLSVLRLGDRTQIQNMRVEQGEIIVEMLTQGSDDPICCPTQQVINVYALRNGALVQISSDTVE